MFSRKPTKNISSRIQQIGNEAITSIIDTNMLIEGEVSFKGKTRVDGNIVGNVNGEHLVLSNEGRIEGDIHATSFICQGTFIGNVTAHVLTASKESTIRGKIIAENISVEPGAVIEGEIQSTQPERKELPDKSCMKLPQEHRQDETPPFQQEPDR